MGYQMPNMPPPMAGSGAYQSNAAVNPYYAQYAAYYQACYGQQYQAQVLSE